MIDIAQRYAGVPIKFGATDCGHFVGECVQALTGHNPADRFEYRNLREAAELVAEHGGIANLLTDCFGPPHAEPAQGDIALIREHPPVLGVVFGQRIVIRTEHDVTDIGLFRAVGFWRG